MFIFRSTLLLAALTLLPHAAYAQTSTPAPTDATSQYGLLEGTITNSDGQPIRQNPGPTEGKEVKGIRQGGGEFTAQADCQMAGLFSVKNIRPGIYDIILTKGFVGDTTYCPERIYGVIIKPGERTVLKIVMDQGDTYEEVGKPAMVSAPATNVTDELARMQKQIDDLKAQIAALTKAMPAASATPAKP